MPITFRLLISVGPAFRLLLGLRFETGASLHRRPLSDAQPASLARDLARRLPPRLARDVLRDE